MRKVRLNNYDLAVGLKWSSIARGKNASAISVLAKEQDLSFGFSRKVVNGESVVYQAALTSDSKCKGAISGSAVLADKFKSILFVERISDTEVWICLAYNHEVMLSGDRIVKIKDAATAIEDALSDLGPNVSISVVYGPEFKEYTETENDFLGELEKHDEIHSFDDLMEIVGVKSYENEFRKYRVKLIVSRNTVIIGSFVGAALILGGGYKLFMASQPEQVVVAQPVVPIQNMIDSDEKSNEQILDDAFQEEIDWLRDKFNTFDTVSVLKRFYAVAIKDPRDVNGWVATNLSYNAVSPLVVKHSWDRSALGTPLTFRRALSNDVKVSFKADGGGADTYKNVFVKTDNGYTPKNFDVVKFIKSNDYKGERIEHDLIALNLKYVLKRHDFGSRDRRIEGLKRGAISLENQRQLQLTGSSVTISGNSMEEFLKLIPIMDKAKTFELKKITADLGNDSWVVEGVIYEK